MTIITRIFFDGTSWQSATFGIPRAPEMGEHTHAVLQELLGLDEQTLRLLAQSGVI